MFQFVLTTKIEYYVNRLIACDFNLNEQRKIKDYRYRLTACDSFRSTNKIKRKCRIIKIDLSLAILSVSRRKKKFSILFNDLHDTYINASTDIFTFTMLRA